MTTPENNLLCTPHRAIAAACHAAHAAAEAFVGATTPNPPVGCAILDGQGVILAVAAHERAGGAHAEVAALTVCRTQGLLEQARTLVVTLEPCNHHGRTPPCTDAVLDSPIEALWIGATDPNPKVAGGGATRLAGAGIRVGAWADLDDPAAASLDRSAARLIAPFSTRCAAGRPWLTLKQAVTADGGMVAPSGKGTFTSPASLTLAHRLRRRADAIITGSGCILADDPAFTVRHVADHAGKQRVLAILDRRGRTPVSYVRAAEARGFDVILHRDVEALLGDLAGEGVIEALVEAGPTLHQAFLDRDLWDERVVIRQARTPDEDDQVETITRPVN